MSDKMGDEPYKKGGSRGMTDMKRITLTLPDEAAAQLKAVKREMFYDKSHAEMYRWLIAKGLETASKSLKAEGENKE